MENKYNFEKRMAEKALSTSQMGKALQMAGKMLSSFQGCSGEPMGNGGGEVLYPAGEKMCYFFGSQKEPVVLQDDITDGTMTVGVKRADGRMNRVDVEYLKPIETCNRNYQFPDDEIEDEGEDD